jgi:hypothetical protein
LRWAGAAHIPCLLRQLRLVGVLAGCALLPARSCRRRRRASVHGVGRQGAATGSRRRGRPRHTRRRRGRLRRDQQHRGWQGRPRSMPRRTCPIALLGFCASSSRAAVDPYAGRHWRHSGGVTDGGCGADTCGARVSADMRGSGFEVDVPAALRRDADLYQVSPTDSNPVSLKSPDQ